MLVPGDAAQVLHAQVQHPRRQGHVHSRIFLAPQVLKVERGLARLPCVRQLRSL